MSIEWKSKYGAHGVACEAHLAPKRNTTILGIVSEVQTEAACPECEAEAKALATTAWLPTRPYGVIDAINRMAAATGSPRYAMAASHADYNGHAVGVAFNDYRGYWIAEYTWAGRNVIARGSFEQCLRAAKAEYDRGALGASVHVGFSADPRASLSMDEQKALAASLGFVPHNRAVEEAHDATWRDERHDLVNEAMRYERQMGVPATGILANCTSAADYYEKVRAFISERRAPRS